MLLYLDWNDVEGKDHAHKHFNNKANIIPRHQIRQRTGENNLNPQIWKYVIKIFLKN